MTTQIKLTINAISARWNNGRWECQVDFESHYILTDRAGDLSAGEAVAAICREYGLSEDGIEVRADQLAAYWDCEPICRSLRLDCETGSCEAWIKRDRTTGLMTLETAEGDYWLIGGCSDRDVQDILDRFATDDERWEVG